MKITIGKEIPSHVDSELSSYPEFLRELLYYRGIETGTQAENFLNPDYVRDSHDPYLIKDMDKAVERVLKAVKNDEKTVIYSDYDADGIPGAVVLHDFFKKIGYTNFVNYIPHRHNEGFGLNLEAVEEFGKSEAELLITIDCGIADNEEVESANKLGIDVIITDHHEPNGEVPRAYAILNSKQKDCNYPFKMLCGSGVIFKLIQAILWKENFGLKEGMEKWFLDMVGLATMADMVPLHGENRVFAFYGLKVLQKSPRVGLMKLLSKLKVSQRHLSEDDIGFTIVPRINAASRMGIPMDAFTLLSTTDEGVAGAMAEHLNKINDERKGIVASIVKEIRHIISERGTREKKKIIVVGNPKWKPALLGLAANTLMEDYRCPVFVWGREDGPTIKGSCRSDGSVDLVALMERTKDSFLEFGGHKMSGGFSVSHEKIHFLEDELSRVYDELAIGVKTTDTQIFIYKKLSVDEVSWDTWKHIEKLAPFGMGNAKPVFLFERAELQGAKIFGKQENHLELGFLNSNGKSVKAIGFFMKPEDFSMPLKKGERINLVATMEKSMFRNFPELRLRIVDILV